MTRPLLADCRLTSRRHCYDINVFGPLLTTQLALKHLGEGSSIINIGSMGTEFAPSGSAIYTGTKGAIDSFTSVLVNELGPKKIRFSSLKPGMIATDNVLAAGIPDSAFGKATIAKTPLGRSGTTQDVSDVAVFLASDDARWITGAHIPVAGGFK
ncbi:SDR family NAD(P)-dependent oxidoreductase [Collimonas pratensis]|uniref:SDR family NAD(P)-dependent oxidoreductase n=1 Tax=Collimonas pratensis TaxID=279113 RepID=UPI0030B82FFA